MTKKRWKWLPGIQAAVLLLLMLLLIFPGMNRTFYANDLICQLGKQGGGVVYADENTDSQGWFVRTDRLKLGYGVYKITVEYESTADSSFLYFASEKQAATDVDNIDRFYSDITYLTEGYNTVTTDVYVKLGSNDYYTGCIFGGDGTLAIKSITVHKSVGGVLRGIIIYILIMSLVDMLIVFRDKRREGKIKDESIKVFFVLVAAVVISSLPLGVDYLTKGHDLLFHLSRIEGIKNGILSGQFPIKIYSNWLCGNGYAAGVYYGDIVLYIPALLRIAGFNCMESYKIFVVLCNIATCAVSYYCFKKMSGSIKTGTVGAVLYTLSVYRLIDVYVRSSVGEYAAMIFLPVIAYGLYRIYTDEVDSTGFSKHWITLVIGFAGIINTHLITCEMVAGFTILFCLIMFKKTFKKERFIVLLKTVVYTSIVCVGFLLPFLRYFMKGGIIAVDADHFPNGIQQYGAYLSQIFEFVTAASGDVMSTKTGVAGEMPISVGTGLGFGAVVMIYVIAMGHVKRKQDKKGICIVLIFTVLSIWLSTCCFPWNLLKESSSKLSGIISNIQFPWRFLSITTIMLVIGIILSLRVIEDKKTYSFIAAGIIALNLIQSMSFLSGVLNEAEPYRAYQENDLDMVTAVAGAEYLPSNVLLELFEVQYALPSDNVDFVQEYRNQNYIEFSASNQSAEEGNVLFSIVYYDGYTAADKDTGEKLELYKDNGRMAVKIHPGYSGHVVLKFTGYTSWKITAVISIICVLMLVIEAVKYKTGFIQWWRQLWKKRRG